MRFCSGFITKCGLLSTIVLPCGINSDFNIILDRTVASSYLCIIMVINNPHKTSTKAYNEVVTCSLFRLLSVISNKLVQNLGGV